MRRRGCPLGAAEQGEGEGELRRSLTLQCWLQRKARRREYQQLLRGNLRNKEHRARGARTSSTWPATIAAITYRVHIGMDGTLHGTLLSPKKPVSIGHSAARTCRFQPISSARFCCLGDEGFVLSVRPGCPFGEDCGTVLCGVVGRSLSWRRRD